MRVISLWRVFHVKCHSTEPSAKSQEFSAKRQESRTKNQDDSQGQVDVTSLSVLEIQSLLKTLSPSHYSFRGGLRVLGDIPDWQYVEVAEASNFNVDWPE